MSDVLLKPGQEDLVAQLLQLHGAYMKETKLAEARRNLIPFCHHVMSEFRSPAHIRAIADLLERAERGEVSRILITMPPRHGKSRVISNLFPAWYFGRNPGSELIFTTYNQDLAEDNGRYVKNTINALEFREVFPDVRIRNDSASARRFSTYQKGNYFAVGVGGPLTGRGAKCFPAGTMVTTEYGPVAIEHLVHSSDRPRVLAYDHDSGALVWRRIMAVRTDWTDELVEIQTSGGRKVRATGQHRFYDSERGYREAALLGSGDRLLSVVVSKQQDMRELRRGEDRSRRRVQAVLPRTAQACRGSQVRELLGRIRAAALRIREGFAERARRLLLRPAVLAGASRYQECAPVRDLQRADQVAQEHDVLFAGLPARGPAAEVSAGKGLHSVLAGISAAYQPTAVLLGGMCGRGAFDAHDRGGQFALQGREQLRILVPGDAADHPGAGRLSVRGLQDPRENDRVHAGREGSDADQYEDPSHRRERDGQSAGEPGDDVPHLSCGSPQVEDDTVSVVGRVRTGRIPVYDIQVEGTSNFFANEILVHNCLIIDDPLKNREEAESASIRQALIDWYTSTAYTRLAPGGIVVIVQTRWHTTDLAGVVLQQEHEGWVHLDLPAILDERSAQFLDRNVGEALWPEQFDLDTLLRTKKSIPARDWASLYQQSPVTEGGNIVKRESVKDWTDPEPPYCDFIIASFDTAFGTKQANDPTAMTVWGLFHDANDVRHTILLDAKQKRVEFPELKKWIIDCDERHKPDIILVENKASGQSLLQEMRRLQVPVQAYNPGRQDKVARLEACTPLFENGKIWAPLNRDYTQEWLEQLVTFPAAKHDDLVDSTTAALQRLRRFGDLTTSDDYEPEDDDAADDNRAASYW
jgi:predicted phage terminase large subunit-like protein